MPNFKCPVPNTMNYATANGFMLSITKLPNIEFFCTEANIPGITLPAIDTNFPLSMVPVPGDIMTFDPLTIQFLIVEDFSNYEAIFNWMIGLGFPESNDQYRNFIQSQDTNLYGELAKGYSDGFIQPLNGQNNSTRTFRFVDMFPTRLESLQLSSILTDVVYLAGVATFEYNYFKIED